AVRGTPQAHVAATQSARRPNRRLSSASTTLSPQTEEVPFAQPVPATAPVSRRTTTTTTGTSTGRPSSRSGRGQSNDRLPAQKQRPAPARKEAPAKGSRAVRTTSTPARAGKQQSAVVDADTPTPSTGRPVSVAGQDSKADMDHLASGMKRIRINLITQSQREAKEKIAASESDAAKHTEADREAMTAESSENTPTPVAEGVASMSVPEARDTEEPPAVLLFHAPAPAPAPAHAPAPPTPSLSGGVSTPAEGSNPSSASSPSGLVHSRSSASPDAPQVAAAHEASGVDANDMLIIPYEPEGPTESATTLITAEALKWLPPRGPRDSWPLTSAVPPAESTAPVAAQSSRLFRYQHNAGIPFAPRPDKATPAEKQVDLKSTQHSLWRASEGGLG
ncbi:hypothetical protein E4U53_004834, partial [Claviceps sorghi]